MLGILAVILSLVVVGGVLGLVGIALGVAQLRQPHAPRGLARWGTGLSVLGVVASLVLGFGYYQLGQQLRKNMQSGGGGAALSSWEGVAAPELTVTTLEGRKLSLAELRGKRVVLDFWATWCPPCVKEIPHFIDLYKETSRAELEIVGISSGEYGAQAVRRAEGNQLSHRFGGKTRRALQRCAVHSHDVFH